MLRLGHIDFTNCVPVHALLLARPDPGVVFRFGTPTELNAALSSGLVDVAPCSSIEYARHAPRYRLLPGLVIGADGPVRSIVLESEADPADLSDGVVAIPTSSATSVVLLRLLLEERLGARPRYRRFEQGVGADPLSQGADAALWIGDAALQRPTVAGRQFLDLGAAWRDWTGLPFAFALWQTSLGPARDPDLERLHRLLTESLAFFRSNAGSIADRYAERVGLRPDILLGYWSELQYEMDDAMLAGLERFYRMASEIGEAPSAPALRWTPAAPSVTAPAR